VKNSLHSSSISLARSLRTTRSWCLLMWSGCSPLLLPRTPSRLHPQSRGATMRPSPPDLMMPTSSQTAHPPDLPSKSQQFTYKRSNYKQQDDTPIGIPVHAAIPNFYMKCLINKLQGSKLRPIQSPIKLPFLWRLKLWVESLLCWLFSCDKD